VVCLTALLNVILPSTKTELIHVVNKHFSQRIEVSRVYFIPPSFVIFNDARVYDRDDPEPVFICGRIRAHLSLADALLKRRLTVARVDCHGFRSSHMRFAVFLRNNYRQILEFLQSLPLEDMRLYLNDAQLESEDERRASRQFARLDAWLAVENGVVASEGIVRTREVLQRSRRVIAAAPLGYRIRLTFAGRGFLLESAEVSRENCYVKAWGDIDPARLSVNGFAFFNTSHKESQYRDPGIVQVPRFSLVETPSFGSVPALAMGDADLVILDVKASVALDLPRIDIQELSCAVNNVPLTLKGRIVFGTPAAIDLKLSANVASARGQAGSRAPSGVKKADALVKGYFQNAVFKGSAALSLLLSREEKSNNPLDKAEILLRQVEIYLGGGTKQVIHLSGASIVCQSPSTRYAVTIDRGVVLLRHLRKKLFDVRCNALLYDGRLRTRASLDASSFPPRVESVMILKNLDTQRMNEVLVHFSKVYGRMFGQMKFVSWPKPVLKGNVSIKNGLLRNFEFFQWLSGQFVLPALRDVAFARTSLAFVVERQGSRMHLIHLASPDVRLGGYFRLDTKNFVSSKIDLSLGKDMLKESPKVRGFAGMLADGEKYLDFSFQLSGPLQSMNFQWLESDAKRRLQNAIPNFIERKLEKNVQNMLAP
jgi:hypothetical protein